MQETFSNYLKLPSILTPVASSLLVHELFNALASANATRTKLGPKGAELANTTNQWGDRAIHLDIKAEEAVLESLKAAKVPARVVTEEHGIVELCANPTLTAVLDGIDGSGACQRDFLNGRYATMLVLFAGTNPTYSDYLCCGVFEHTRRELYLGVKGNGAWRISERGTERIYSDSQSHLLSSSTVILADNYWDVVKRTFTEPMTALGINWGCLKVCAASYVDVACGKAQLYFECTRKHNLEPAVAYGLIREAKGCLTTIDGQDIGLKRYFDFGWEPEDHHGLICAANYDLLVEIRRTLKIG